MCLKCCALILIYQYANNFSYQCCYGMAWMMHTAVYFYRLYSKNQEELSSNINFTDVDYLKAEPNLGLLIRIWRSMEQILYGLILLLLCKYTLKPHLPHNQYVYLLQMYHIQGNIHLPFFFAPFAASISWWNINRANFSFKEWIQ